MDFSTGNLKESVSKSFVTALISVPLTRFALDWYAALTISIGHRGVISSMIDGATIVAAGLVFVSVFFSNYIEIEV